MQCFVKLEIFLSKQLRKDWQKSLPMRTALHANQSDDYQPHYSEAGLVRIRPRNSSESPFLLMKFSASFSTTQKPTVLYFSFRKGVFQTKWRRRKNASRKGPTISLGHRASPSSTSVSSVPSLATKSLIFSTTWNTTCVKTPSPWCLRKMGKQSDSSRL